jgi:hypothetical protein
VTVSWNSPSAERIRDAIASGELECPQELRGKQLDLSDYFATPEDLRIGYSILKNARFTPLEVDLLRERERVKESMKKEPDPLKLSEFQRLLVEVEARLLVEIEARLQVKVTGA